MTQSLAAVAEIAHGWVTLPTGTRLHYERAGKGQPVLLLHGIADSTRAWRHVMAPLAAEYDVIALDLPGCGRSDKPETDYSLGAQAAAVRFFLDALSLDLVTVVGHSLGGGVAMTFSYHYPERVGRLALVASGGLGRDLHPMFKAATLPVVPKYVVRLLFDRRIRRVRNFVQLLYGQFGRDPLFVNPWAYRAELAELLEAMESPGAQAAFFSMLGSASNVAGQAVSALDRLHLARFPFLIVWGKEDRVFPVAHGVRAATLVPHARLVVLDGCGHLPQIECADRFIRVLRRWLRSTTPVRLQVKAVIGAGGITQRVVA
jgi:pimeloyl-ACP methyl ester carboxylesterase